MKNLGFLSYLDMLLNMKRHWFWSKKSNLIVIGLGFIAIVTMLKSSDEPCLFDGCVYLAQFEVGNSIIFTLSSGFLVSLIFWLLAIVLPQKEKRELWKAKLIDDYNVFRKFSQKVVFKALSIDNHQSLPMSGLEFKEFLNQENRWNLFRSELQSDKQLRRQVIAEMEKLQSGFDYAFSIHDFESKESLQFFEDLKGQINWLKGIDDIEYEQDKYLSDFLYEVACWFTTATGQFNYDPIEARIKKF